MATFVARRAALSIRPSYAGCRRAIHSTPIVQKKRANVEIEDLFSDEAEEDLFSAKPAPSEPAKATKSAGVTKTSAKPVPEASTSKAVSTPVKKEKNRKLSEKTRIERFNAIVDFITPRIGRHPTVKMPMVRNSAWVHLVQLATTEEQLEQVTGMFSGWKEAGNKFDDALSELFVRRCEELRCPLLALKIYGDFAKYSLPLSLPAARQLLHSLHNEHPLETLMTAVSLYDTYSLPSISEDLVSASLVASACFKHNSKDSVIVAKAIVPQIQGMLAETEPRKQKKRPGQKTTFDEKPSIWMKWALKKIDKAIFVQTNERAEWLKEWRTKSGHLVGSAQY